MGVLVRSGPSLSLAYSHVLGLVGTPNKVFAAWACLLHRTLGAWPTGLPRAGLAHIGRSHDDSLLRLQQGLAHLGSWVPLKPYA